MRDDNTTTIHVAKIGKYKQSLKDAERWKLANSKRNSPLFSFFHWILFSE